MFLIGRTNWNVSFVNPYTQKCSNISYILYDTIRSEVYPGYFQDDLFKKDISSLIERCVQTLFEGQMSKIQGTIRNFITLMAHLK